MGTFPALEPAARSHVLPIYPLSAVAHAAGAVRFRHGSTGTGYRLLLSFDLLTEAEADLIRDHYRGQAGGTLSFEITATTWAGYAPAGVPAVGLPWRYAKAPEEGHRSGGLIDLSVELVSVEPVILTGSAVLGTITLSMVPGAASSYQTVPLGTITLSLAPGAASGGSGVRIVGMHLDGNLTDSTANNEPSGSGLTFITSGQKFGSGAVTVAGGNSGSYLSLSAEGQPMYFPFGTRIQNRDFVFRFWVKIPNNTQTADLAGNDYGSYSSFKVRIENGILKWVQSYNGTTTTQSYGTVPVDQWAFIEIGRVSSVVRGSIDGTVSGNTLAMTASDAWEDDAMNAVSYNNQMAVTIDDFEFLTGGGPRTASFTPPISAF